MNHTSTIRFSREAQCDKGLSVVETPMTGDFKGQKMMKPDALAKEFIKGLQSDTLEIKPGQSSQMKMMSRLAPSFIFNAINKQFAG